MTIRMTIRGDKEVARNLTKLGKKAPAVVGAALWRQGQRILTMSQPEVPVLTGRLRGSGTVTPPFGGARPQVIIGYGGAARLYARKQHENEWYQHPRGGKSHFLRDPFNNHVRGPFLAELTADLKGQLYG